jgi:hypothetical protein
LRCWLQVLALGAGMLIISVSLAYGFGRFHGGLLSSNNH